VRAPYLDDGDVRLYLGDCLEVLAEMEAESVQTCVTSPPYWGLRDYGTASWEGGSDECDHVGDPLASAASTLTGNRGEGVRPGDKLTTNGRPYRETCGKCGARRVDAQIGLEESPAAYVARMVEVFREVRRVLRDDGTLWLNLGDSYFATGKGPTPPTGIHGKNGTPYSVHGVYRHETLKEKDLVGIPWRVAFALQEDGWYLRSDIIWSKPNPMPESVTDRPTKAHEYLFLLAKSPRYFYDYEAIREPLVSTPEQYAKAGKSVRENHAFGSVAARPLGPSSFATVPDGRNARSVWTITTKPYSGAHFATFPPELPERCIKAGTPEAGCCASCGAPIERVIVATGPDGRKAEMKGRKAYDENGQPLIGDNALEDDALIRGSFTASRGLLKRETAGFRPSCGCDAGVVPAVVLDPFSGSGTTAFVARQLARRAVGIDLNAEYLDLAADRLKQLSLFSEAAE